MKKSLFLPFPTPWSYPECLQVYLTHVCPQLLRHPLTLGKPKSALLICHKPLVALLGWSVQEFPPRLHLRYHRFGRLWELSHPSSAVSPSEHSCILTKVLHSLFLHSCINCKHKGKSNQQGSKYMSLSATYRKSLCCCILSQLLMKDVPLHLLWWSCGEFVDHISEWQSAYSKFSKSECFEKEKGHDLFSTVCRYWKG